MAESCLAPIAHKARRSEHEVKKVNYYIEYLMIVNTFLTLEQIGKIHFLGNQVGIWDRQQN